MNENILTYDEKLVKISERKSKKAHKGRLVIYSFPEIVDNLSGNPVIAIQENIDILADVISTLLIKDKSLKIWINVGFTAYKIHDIEKTSPSNGWFTTQHIIYLISSNVKNELQKQINTISTKIDEYTSKGSGWVIEKILEVTLKVNIHTIPKAGSWIPTPKKLSDKKAIVNITNKDQNCFYHTIIAALNPVNDNSGRLKSYEFAVNKVVEDSYKTPMPINAVDYRIFEEANKISLNVFGYEDGSIYPIYISEFDRLVIENNMEKTEPKEINTKINKKTTTKNVVKKLLLLRLLLKKLLLLRLLLKNPLQKMMKKNYTKL